ncbi:hypothetical protein V5R04_15620 [Jonesiaceae bacterium BS-20]|uniref:Uncharacterized protein n=1 Tax=Jonesiaceae bacterium BS-20 TaxID=3120821 RepID=A0AAU7DV79_9MICO
MEASLMQVYAPRDPLREYLRGKITLRKLRVMIEGIPLTPATPIGRVVNGPWGDQERLFHAIASEMRLQRISFYNVHRAEGSQMESFTEFPVPDLTEYQIEAKKAQQSAGPSAYQAQVESDLLRVLNR